MVERSRTRDGVKLNLYFLVIIPQIIPRNQGEMMAPGSKHVVAVVG